MDYTARFKNFTTPGPFNLERLFLYVCTARFIGSELRNEKSHARRCLFNSMHADNGSPAHY